VQKAYKRRFALDVNTLKNQHNTSNFHFQILTFVMQIKSILFAAFCLLIVAACDTHHDHDENDTAAPILTLESPVENTSISGEVSIKGTVTDESLHEMEIKVTQDSDGVELHKATPMVHDKTEYTFHELWTPAVAAETAVTLSIVVEDHNGNKTTKTTKFSVKP